MLLAVLEDEIWHSQPREGPSPPQSRKTSGCERRRVRKVNMRVGQRSGVGKLLVHPTVFLYVRQPLTLYFISQQT